jgi:hypothetical protein
LDLSNNTKLQTLYCRNNLRTSLNLRNHAELRSLYCNNNLLSDLKLSTNPKYGILYCNNNQLSNLELYNTGLHVLECHTNRLPLSELHNAFQKVTISPPIIRLDTQQLVPKVVKVNTAIDYSTQNQVDGIFTIFDIENAVENIDYSLNNGMLTFKDTGNYQLTMTNAAIPVPHKVIVDISVLFEVNIVETPLMASLRIYPNPTVGQLRIENDELRINDVEIYDVVGKKLPLQFPSFGGAGVVLDISHLQSGTYLVRIQTNAGTITKKVIKQ